MNAVVTSAFDESWKEWVRTNIARGCTHASMIEKMVLTGRFTNADATRHVTEYAQTLPPASPDAIQPAVQTHVGTGKYVVPQGRMHDGRLVTNIDGHIVRTMLTLKAPLITLLDNVLTPDECEALMTMAEPKLTRSTVVDNGDGGRKVIRDRTSDGVFFTREENDLIKTIDKRIVALTGIPLNQGEGLQVMRYQVGGEYKVHPDYFPPRLKGSEVNMRQGGQRIATMLMYLQPPVKGGETVFPEIGLSVVPKQGSAVFFEYTDENGNVDPQTLHAGAPVIEGVKWIATRWIRERAF
jgi:prolyl 4-hydroxylase